MEKDPNGLDAKAPGAKLDDGKAPIRQGYLEYFPFAAIAVSLVSLFGALKYSWAGWEDVPDGINRYGNAGVRHIVSGKIGKWEDRDNKLLELLKQNGLPATPKVAHAAQEAWNALARLEFVIKEDGKIEAGK